MEEKRKLFVNPTRYFFSLELTILLSDTQNSNTQ